MTKEFAASPLESSPTSATANLVRSNIRGLLRPLPKPALAALWALGTAGLATRLWLIFGWRFLEEDALITLRYARNLWEGNGFVYNPGERVMGFTSPLWTILVSPIVGTMPIPAARVALTLLCLTLYAGACAVLLRLARSGLALGPWGTVVFFAFLSLEPRLVGESVSGMEMSLFLLVIATTVWALERDKPGASFALASVSYLVRPEGALFWALVFVYFWIRRKKPLLLEAAVPSALPTIPWLAFSTMYFGSPFARSAASKSLWAATEPTLTTILFRPAELDLLWRNATGLYVVKIPAVGRGALVAASAAVYLTAVVLAFRKKQGNRLLMYSLLATLVGFYYFGRAMFFPWYAVPTIVVFALAVASLVDEAAVVVERFSARRSSATVGSMAISDGGTQRQGESSADPRPLPQRADTDERAGEIFSSRLRALAGASGALAIGALVVLFSLRLLPWKEVRDYEETVLKPTGTYLRDCTPPDVVVMLEALGYIGFYSERRILDLAGLVSPQFRPTKEKFAPGWGADQVLSHRPDFLVLRKYEVPENRFFAAFDAPMFRDDGQRREFEASYTKIRDVESTWQPELSLAIYARRGVQVNC